MIRALLVFLAFSASCASVSAPPGAGPGARGARHGSQQDFVGPAPPEKARVRFLYAFTDSRDLGFPVSLFGALKRLFVGERDHGMVRPYAIAVDEDLVAVADPGARALHVFDLGKRRYRKIDQIGGEALASPVGVALGAGRVFVSDSVSGKVFALDRKGDLVFAVDDVKRPTGLAYHQGTSTLYVADTLEFRVCAYDGRGKRLFSFGTRGRDAGEFNYPTHLFLEGETLLVNDTMNFRVQAFDLQGSRRFSLGRHGDGSGEMAQPKGVGMDSEGHVYVADGLSDRVQIFDAEGRFLLAFGGPGNGAGEFWLPAGLFIARDRIYVADSYNRRVQVFQFLGNGEG